MMDYGNHLALLCIIPCYQCCLNLAGKSNDVLDIGSQSVAKSYREKLGWEGGGRTGEHSEWSFCMQVAVYCEEIDRAEGFAKQLKALESNAFARGLFTYPPRVFFFAIIALWQARATGKRRYKKEGRAYAKQIQLWVRKKQNINMAHKHLIVQAELLSLEGKASYASQKALYDQAIAASVRAGFLQDAALAAHLASRALEADRKTYFTRSIEMYSKWGAVAVVSYLLKSLEQSSANASSNGNETVGYRSRTRFDNSLVLSHNSLASSHLQP